MVIAKGCNLCKEMESTDTVNMLDYFEFNILDEEIDIRMEGDFSPPKKHRTFARARHVSREDLRNSPWGIMLKVSKVRTPVGARF